MEGTKRKLSLNLSFLSLTDFTTRHTSGSSRKSPRNFEDPKGGIGLGILAAVDDRGPDLSRKSAVAISPKSASNAIPILDNNRFSKENRDENLVWEETETDHREEYTCVISHIGENLIQRREYFGGSGSVTVENVLRSSSNRSTASDFLNSCFLCKKKLQGLDIFMYRGEMAFCSPECRDRQICIEKKEDKCQSRLRKKKQMEFSVSPCSDSQSFSAEVAAA